MLHQFPSYFDTLGVRHESQQLPVNARRRFSESFSLPFFWDFLFWEFFSHAFFHMTSLKIRTKARKVCYFKSVLKLNRGLKLSKMSWIDSIYVRMHWWTQISCQNDGWSWSKKVLWFKCQKHSLTDLKLKLKHFENHLL